MNESHAIPQFFSGIVRFKRSHLPFGGRRESAGARSRAGHNGTGPEISRQAAKDAKRVPGETTRNEKAKPILSNPMKTQEQRPAGLSLRPLRLGEILFLLSFRFPNVLR